MEHTPALKYQWQRSHCNDLLLHAIDIDARNIVRWVSCFTSGLTAVFPVNLGQLLPPLFSSPTCPRRKPLGISSTRFSGQMLFLSPDQQCQSTEWNSLEYGPQPHIDSSVIASVTYFIPSSCTTGLLKDGALVPLCHLSDCSTPVQLYTFLKTSIHCCNKLKFYLTCCHHNVISNCHVMFFTGEVLNFAYYI